MALSQNQALIMSQQLARLRLHTVTLSTLVKDLSERRDLSATMKERGEDTDMRELRADQLAWGLALTAQSCAYLAIELQVFAEKLSQSQITCPESTYNALFDSIEMFRALLDCMVKNYAECNDSTNEGLVPVFSIPMAEAIRSILALDPAITSGESTISTGSRRTKDTGDAGDTR